MSDARRIAGRLLSDPLCFGVEYCDEVDSKQQAPLKICHALPTIWTHRTAHAGLFLRRDALPAPVAGRSAGGGPGGEPGESGGHRPPRHSSWASTTSRRLAATDRASGNWAWCFPRCRATRSSSRRRSSPPRIRPSSCSTFTSRSTDFNLTTSTCWASTASTTIGCCGIRCGQAAAWRRHASCRSRARSRHVGFSTHGPPDVVREAVQWDGDGGFDYVNLHWYYIYQDNWPAIEEATAARHGRVHHQPVRQGRDALSSAGETGPALPTRCTRWCSTACSACRTPGAHAEHRRVQAERFRSAVAPRSSCWTGRTNCCRRSIGDCETAHGRSGGRGSGRNAMRKASRIGRRRRA